MLKSLLLVLAISLAGFTSWSQKNRYASFFAAIDSSHNGEENLKKLQGFKMKTRLNSTEKIAFYQRVIPAAVKVQKFDLSLKYAFEGESFAREIKNDSLRAKYLNHIGASFYYIGNRNEALNYFEKAARVARSANNRMFEAKIVSNIGAILLEEQKYEPAEKSLKKAIGIYKALHVDRANELIAYRLLATLYTETGRFKLAEPIYKDLVKISKEIKDTATLCFSLTYYSQLMERQGRIKEAIHYSEEALQIQRIEKNRNTLVTVLGTLAINYSKDKQHEKAVEAYREMIKLNKDIFKESLKNSLAETEVKYKTAEIRQQKELAEAKAMAEKRTKELYFFIFLGIILLLAVGFLTVYLKFQDKRKKIEMALQQKHLEDVLDAQEKEKVRIARDLHDGICQKFAATKMQFSALSGDLLDTLPHMKLDYKNCLSLLDEATNELRSIAHEIMPPALNEAGLVEALRMLSNQVFSGQIHYSFEVFGKVEDLGQHENINIYRIAQELFTNVLKHAQAADVSVQVLFSAKQFSFFVEDNGRGFVPGNKTGMGLGNIKLRAELIKARFNIEPVIGGGTFVSIIKEK